MKPYTGQNWARRSTPTFADDVYGKKMKEAFLSQNPDGTIVSTMPIKVHENGMIQHGTELFDEETFLKSSKFIHRKIEDIFRMDKQYSSWDIKEMFILKQKWVDDFGNSMNQVFQVPLPSIKFPIGTELPGTLSGWEFISNDNAFHFKTDAAIRGTAPALAFQCSDSLIIMFG